MKPKMAQRGLWALIGPGWWPVLPNEHDQACLLIQSPTGRDLVLLLPLIEYGTIRTIETFN